MAQHNQQKYHPELDEILQCPICFELPKAPIYQCDKGHHFCEACYDRVKVGVCPVCKARFFGTRNFLAEELIQKLPLLCIPDKPIPPESSTPSNPIPVTVAKNTSTPEHGPNSNAPRFCRGTFPCLLRKCNMRFPAGRMLPHIRYHHPNFLSEVPSSGGKYKQVWHLDYEPDSKYETAIRVSNMGLFFLLIAVDENADLKATLLMVASPEMAGTFSYKIKISDAGSHRKASYSNLVSSCRVNPLYGGSCFMISGTELFNICGIGEELQCHLTVENRNYVEEPTSSSSSSSSTYSSTNIAPVSHANLIRAEASPVPVPRTRVQRNRCYVSSNYDR